MLRILVVRDLDDCSTIFEMFCVMEQDDLLELDLKSRVVMNRIGSRLRLSLRRCWKRTGNRICKLMVRERPFKGMASALTLSCPSIHTTQLIMYVMPILFTCCFVGQSYIFGNRSHLSAIGLLAH